jgi:hypothetical protein
MRNLFVLIFCIFLSGCASVTNSELELVTIKELSTEGTNYFVSPYGRTEIAASNVIQGEGKVFLPRSRENYEATVICPDGEEIVISVETGFDFVKGLYLPLIATVATYGIGIVYSMTSGLIDIYQNKAYSTDDIVLPVGCTE